MDENVDSDEELCNNGGRYISPKK